MKDDDNRLGGWDDLNGLDGLIDHALASYTPHEARPGLERRILAAVAAGSSHSRRPFIRLPWAWTTCAILAVALAFAAIHHYRQVPGQSNRQFIHANSPLLTSAKSNKQDVSPLPRSPVAPIRSNRPSGGNKSVSAIDRSSLHEMRAASHPAPEEPLTQEEKLLLRIVKKGDEKEIAMLNPAIREKQEAEEEAEFHKFVEQSIKGENE